jgi:hypothetical protein
MPDYLIGMNVIETDGNATPAIVGAATSVAGFIVEAQRGPVNVPIKINSWTDFLNSFGGHRGKTTGYFGTYCVEGFFLNGGKEAYVVRPAKSGAPAKRTIEGASSGSKPKKKKEDTGLPPVDESTDTSLKPTVTFVASYLGENNPGLWGNDVVLRISKGNSDDSVNIDIGVKRKGRVRFIESHPDLKAKEMERKLRLNSKVLRIEPNSVAPTSWTDWQNCKGVIKDEAGVKNIDHNLIGLDEKYNSNDDGIFVTLAGGTAVDSTGMLGKEGFRKFDRVDIQMLASPDGERTEWKINKQIMTEGRNYCFRRGDCMYVAGVPHNLGGGDITNVTKETEGLRTGDRLGSYAALYAPYIDVPDPEVPGDLITIPPTGHVMGIYARIDMQRGVWKAPAGDEATLMGVMGLKHRYTDQEHTNLVRKAHINCVRFVPGAGIVVDSSRTLSTKTLWWYVGTRRIFNYVKTSLKSGLRWVRQEPNKKSLWDKVKFNSVNPFLMNLWRNGAFGEGTPEQVFTVKCDSDNNPPYLVDQGLFNLEVYFYPSKPAETIVIKVGQQDSGASAGEA